MEAGGIRERERESDSVVQSVDSSWAQIRVVLGTNFYGMWLAYYFFICFISVLWLICYVWKESSLHVGVLYVMLKIM